MTIYEFLFGPGNVSVAIAPMLLGGIASGVGSIFSAFSSNSRRRRAEREQRRMEKKISTLEANRQTIINPYEDVRDLSGDITNPYANLQVATKASDFQADEADISLASTLDFLRQTGSSAGGATAIAQSALRSKAGISANLEQQEMQNQKLMAQGEFQAQTVRMGEGQRVQQAQAAGKQFQFNAQENREMQQLNRASAMQEGWMEAGAAAQSGFDNAIGGLFGTASSMAAYGIFNSLKKPQ